MYYYSVKHLVEYYWKLPFVYLYFNRRNYTHSGKYKAQLKERGRMSYADNEDPGQPAHAQADLGLHCRLIEIVIYYSEIFIPTNGVMVSICECTGWSGSSLYIYGSRALFSD